MGGGFTKRATASPEYSYSAAVDETKAAVFSGDNNIYGFLVENNGAADIYIQFFDNLIGAVTVGSTAPDFSFKIPANGTLGKDAQDLGLRFCRLGLVMAVTATRTGAGAPASPATVHIWHSKKG